MCGNGLLEPGENYDDPGVGLVGDPSGSECSADGAVAACDATDEQYSFEVVFDAPLGTTPTSTTVLLSYRSELVQIPGSGTARDVRTRVVVTPPTPFVFTANDRDYAVRAVIIRTTPIEEGSLLTATFDACAGAQAPTAADLSCFVEGCSGAGGQIGGCGCSVRPAP